MATIRLAGEIFEGYNKPKRTPGDSKKFAVAQVEARVPGKQLQVAWSEAQFDAGRAHCHR